MAYINTPYASNGEQTPVPLNTNYNIAIINSFRVSNDHNVALTIDILLDGTVNTYLVKSLDMPVGTSFCLEGPIPYDIATTDIHITATPASGTAAYSVSIDYSPVLKRI